MTYNGIVKGRSIELDTALPYPEGQAVTVNVEAVSRFAIGSPQAILHAARQSPHLTSVWMMSMRWTRIIR